MKKTIINKSNSIRKVFTSIIVLTILLPYNIIAQDDYQRPIQPQNYLYLPSFIEHGMGIDVGENTGNGKHYYQNILNHCVIGNFDSTFALPMEGISQKFMIDSAITIYGIALWRDMRHEEVDSWAFEDSVQIRSLDHDTIYRSVSIAHSKKPEFLDGVFEYYFDSLTLTTPFTVVRTYSRENYRTEDACFNTSMHCTGRNRETNDECHSYQSPSKKYYGDSLWYDMKNDPHVGSLHISDSAVWDSYYYFFTDSLYTDLYMLPIYKKVQEPKHTIRVAVGPEHYCGNVEGGGVYDRLTYVTLQATANENYRFAQWNDGNTENPRTIRVMSDSTFTAIFDTVFKVNVSTEPAYYGNVLGGGSYARYSEATLRVGTRANYYFIRWNDGNRDNPRIITVTSDTTLVAILDTIPPTSIDMAEISEGITLHPNPATTTLNIELPNNLNCTAELRNIKGVLIETRRLEGYAQWNIEALPPGVYMLTFRNKDVSITRKFVKK
ncbi:MAG: T9SS type A sorting domain-containing protein [Bacteroidales bacterium]|nr:T9SS type A sorting domain-containing protein [Bacteroidales bacterium]